MQRRSGHRSCINFSTLFATVYESGCLCFLMQILVNPCVCSNLLSFYSNCEMMEPRSWGFMNLSLRETPEELYRKMNLKELAEIQDRIRAVFAS